MNDLTSGYTRGEKYNFNSFHSVEFRKEYLPIYLRSLVRYDIWTFWGATVDEADSRAVNGILTSAKTPPFSKLKSLVLIQEALFSKLSFLRIGVLRFVGESMRLLLRVKLIIESRKR